MSTAEYRKAFNEAEGNREVYDKATTLFPRPCRMSAMQFWQQFERETRVRVFVAKNAGEVLLFLRQLPVSHMEHSVSTTYSKDIESGYVKVYSDPNKKTLQIVGSAEDV